MPFFTLLISYQIFYLLIYSVLFASNIFILAKHYFNTALFYCPNFAKKRGGAKHPPPLF